MMDGFGDDYYRASDMPTLNKLEKQGIYKVVPGLMPSVTNVNNASIVTGEPPALCRTRAPAEGGDLPESWVGV